MSFYGFQPQSKKRGDTARQVGAIGAQAAIAIPEAKRADDERKRVDKQREDAAKAILADTELASTNWKTWKETYANQAKGVLPDEQIQANLKMITMPRQTDLLDVASLKDYLNRFSSNTATLFKELNAKRAEVTKKKEEEQKTTGMGEDIQTSIAGKEAVEYPRAPGQPAEVIQPGIPEAKTTDEVYERIKPETAMDPAAQKTIKETGLPSKFDLDNQNILKDYRKRMLGRGYGNDKVDKAMANLEYLRKQRRDNVAAEQNIETQKKNILTLYNKINKEKKVDPQDMMEMKAWGIDSSDFADNIDELLIELKLESRNAEGSLKKQKSYNTDIENAYNDLLDNPNAEIHSVLKSGQQESITTYEDEPEEQLNRPPAIGGPKQMGRGIPVKKETPQIPQKQPRSTSEDQVAIKWAREQLAITDVQNMGPEEVAKLRKNQEYAIQILEKNKVR